MKILVVEDNELIWNSIKKFLLWKWFVVDLINNWVKANKIILEKAYNLYIIDLMLPWIDWITICKEIRKISSAPIIITTSKWQIEDKSIGFSIWADDYLVKPFDLQELYLRINNLLKRSSQIDVFNFEDISIDINSKSIYKWWVFIKLTNKEFLIIEYLLNNIWLAVSRTDIIDFIWWWDQLFENDDKLDVYISNIRKKLSKNLILTIKWFWYKIERN